LAYPTEKIELPPKYYLDYFSYLVDFVTKKYDHILNENENAFINNYQLLTENEKCLFIRFINRTGRFFRTEKLKYEEIGELKPILATLAEKNFIEKPNKNWLPIATEFLQIFPKNELLAMFKNAGISFKGHTGYSKNETVEKLLSLITHEDLLIIVEDYEAIIKVNFEVEVMMLKFLFFGNRYDSMTEFVTRDLGFQKYEQFDEDKMVAHFANRQEAEDKLLVSLVGEKFYELSATLPPAELCIWFINWVLVNEETISDPGKMSLERLKLRVAAYFEKAKQPLEAYDIFCLTELPPSRERRIRILAKTDRTEEAIQLCNAILGDPYSTDELYFAIDFAKKLESKNAKKRVKKSVTIQLHDSETIFIDPIWKNRVEAGVIDYYEQKGEMAVFSENFLWKSLFGLLFWDVIYDTESLAIHHPLQRAPSDIYKPIFFELRRDKLLNRLDLLEEKEELLFYIEKTFLEKQGITNPMVDWSAITYHSVLKMCEKLEPNQIRLVMLEMAINIKNNTHGFPDLFTWSTDSYEFIEVKSPSDNLSNQQLYWLRFFERIGIKSKVLRVDWLKTDTEKLFG
jgi:hypothetical protein